MNQVVVRYKRFSLALLALLPLATLGLAVWAYLAPQGLPFWGVALGALLTVAAGLVLVQAFAFRVTADEVGLTVSGIRQTSYLPWPDVRGVRLSIRTPSVEIGQRREATRDPYNATHATILTSGEPITLSAWMSGVGELLQMLADRGLLDEPPATPFERVVGEAQTKLNALEDLRLIAIVVIVAALFVLYAGGLLGKALGGNCFAGALLAAVALAAGIGGAIGLAAHYRRRALGGADRPSELGRRDVLIGIAATAMAGCLFVWYGPDFFDPPKHPWVHRGLVFLGVAFLGAALRDLARYARGR